MNNKKGFTLIELLVVISIIAMLLAVLMPALSKAKSAGERVVCGSNLHQMGLMCFNYAQDHEDIMPKAMIMHNQGDEKRRICIPINLNDVSPKSNLNEDGTPGIYSDDEERMDDGRDGYWQKYGTPVEYMVKYGMAEDAFLCPSERWRKRGWNYAQYVEVGKMFHSGADWWPKVAGWRRFVQISYMYLSGVYDTTLCRFNCRKVKPWKRHTKSPSNTVLAADAVMVCPPETAAWTWGRREISINHVSKADEGKVTYQSVLKGDGSASGHGGSFYDISVREDYDFVKDLKGQWSYDYAKVGPWCYWEGLKRDKLGRNEPMGY